MSKYQEEELKEKESADNTGSESQTTEIYKQALTFNVVAKYDPAITQLLHISSYCVIYQYDEDAEDWVKTSYMGPVGVYSRRSFWDKYSDNVPDNEIEHVSVEDLLQAKHGEYYKFGLLVLNRVQPENFSLGFLGDRYLREVDIVEERNMLVEKSDELIIVRDFEGKAFGLWIFDPKDRDYLYQLLLYCIEKLE
jgi:mRNA-decapping enzyme subunit 1